MLFFVALFIWFALSIPATLIVGRMLEGAAGESPAPAPERRVGTRTRGLVRS